MKNLISFLRLNVLILFLIVPHKSWPFVIVVTEPRKPNRTSASAGNSYSVPQTNATPKPQKRRKKPVKRRVPVPRYTPVPNGTWGGAGILLNISANGATIEFNCAGGRIDKPLRIDAKGMFVANGIHTQEQGGPIRIDALPNSQAARYSGRTTGDTMTLTVSLLETGKAIGEFTLRRGGNPLMRQCN